MLPVRKVLWAIRETPGLREHREHREIQVRREMLEIRVFREFRGM